MTFVCVKESEDYLICNGTRYDPYEGALSYKDTMFWVYLGVYVGLVLFAGKDVISLLYFYHSVVSALLLRFGRKKPERLNPNELDVTYVGKKEYII